MTRPAFVATLVCFLLSYIAVGRGLKTNTTECIKLFDTIPITCGKLSTYNGALSLAFNNSDSFLSMFCESNCARPVYEYTSQCVSIFDAYTLDFLCSKSGSGTLCANILSDGETFTQETSDVCADVSDEQCSRECQVAFQGFDKVYGCCFFWYSSIADNITYAAALYSACGVNNPGLCTGGITGEFTSTPGTITPSNEAVGSLLNITFFTIPALLLAVLL